MGVWCNDVRRTNDILPLSRPVMYTRPYFACRLPLYSYSPHDFRPFCELVCCYYYCSANNEESHCRRHYAKTKLYNVTVFRADTVLFDLQTRNQFDRVLSRIGFDIGAHSFQQNARLPPLRGNLSGQERLLKPYGPHTPPP